MRTLLAGADCELCTAWLTENTSLSDRQMQRLLPEGPDILLLDGAVKKAEYLREFDAIIISKNITPIRDLIERRTFRYEGNRPCLITFQAGLEFDPERGFSNRRHADAIFSAPKTDIDTFRTWCDDANVPQPYSGFGHPVFLRPEPVARPQASRDVYFFTQAISPPTRRARLHLVHVLAAIARANPDRNIWLKLRHLPNENCWHVHREQFPYTDLLQTTGAGRPENLKLTVEPMNKALDKAGIGITCTSTAAIDLVREGVPTMVYLDYPENYFDPMVALMRELFDKSGLIAPLEDVLNLNAKPVNQGWLDQMFCTPDHLVAQVIEVITRFKARAGATCQVIV